MFLFDGCYVYFFYDVMLGKIFYYLKDFVVGIYKIKCYDCEIGEIEIIIDGMGGVIWLIFLLDGKKFVYIKCDDF